MTPRADHFARWLEATMRNRGLSQAAIAREVGVADAQVSRWRRGQVTPTVRHLQRIADTLGVPRIELDRLAGYPVEGEGAPSLADPVLAAEMQAQMARLERVLASKVPAQLWPAYVAACEALADTLTASFRDAQHQVEKESSRRPIGFRREE